MKNISRNCIPILRRMLNQERIGERHIPETICLRWIKHLPKREHKEALKDWAYCINEGLILIKMKPTEKHVSLNPRRLPEIYDLVK